MSLELNYKLRSNNSLESYSRLKDLEDKHSIMPSRENKTMPRLKEK